MVQDLAETPSANIIFLLLFNEFHEIIVFNKFFEVASTNLCLELNTLWVRIELTLNSSTTAVICARRRLPSVSSRSKKVRFNIFSIPMGIGLGSPCSEIPRDLTNSPTGTSSGSPLGRDGNGSTSYFSYRRSSRLVVLC